MATEFLMPKLGLTMEAGTITEWLVPDGAMVEVGVAILRIETDKTETDVEAATAGRLKIVGQTGDTFACGERIGWLLAADEQAPSADPALVAAPAETLATDAPAGDARASVSASSVAATIGGRIIASPYAKRLAIERGLDLRAFRGTGPGGRIVAADLDDIVAPSTSGVRGTTAERVRATTAGRQLADLLGIDVADVAVDPVDGNVTRETVARHVRQLLAAAKTGPVAPNSPTTPPTPAIAEPSRPSRPPALAPALQDPTATIRLSGMRGTIAKRMHESLAQMAQLTLFMDADLDAVVADRNRRAAEGPPPSYTDYMIAAAARALYKHPIVNSQITDDGVALLPIVHVGMAVALDGGLIVPVITNTADRDLASLTGETSRLADAARAGSLKLADLAGGTFSVSTLGMFGVDGFTPVINPPNTCILGVGRLRDDLVLDSAGMVTTSKRLTLSLTWDHRAFDGAPAAAFCRTIVELLNNPSALDAPPSRGDSE